MAEPRRMILFCPDCGWQIEGEEGGIGAGRCCRSLSFVVFEEFERAEAERAVRWAISEKRGLWQQGHELVPATFDG